jgi:hypothetical protein
MAHYEGHPTIYTKYILDVLKASLDTAHIASRELAKQSDDVNDLTDYDAANMRAANLTDAEWDELTAAWGNVNSALAYLQRASRRVRRVHDAAYERAYGMKYEGE